MEDQSPRGQALNLFAQHIANLFDRVIGRPDSLDLVGMYNAGDLAFQIHNGELVIARTDIAPPPNEVPTEWLDGN